MYEVIDMKRTKHTRILCASKGTPMQFAQALQARISELGGESVDSATRMKKQPVNAAAGFLAKAIAVMGEAAVSMFLDKLIDKVMEWLSGQGVEGVDVTHDNDNLIVNLLGEAINIPLEGLHFDPDMIDDALKQVVDFLKGAINASTDINGQYPNDDDDDDRYYSDFGNDTDYDSDDEQYIDASTEPAVDAEVERYLHTLVGDVQTELSSEVECVKFSNDNANLYVTVTYMGSEIDYTVPLADLDLLWDNMESDVAYIVNTILQDLDNM